MLSINVQETPLHVVVWKGENSTTAEITQLKKRVEELESLVRQFLEHKPHAQAQAQVKVQEENKPELKITKSPFFKSTNVPEPVGLSVLTHLDLDAQSEGHVSVNEVEVFDKLTKEPVTIPIAAAVPVKQEKRVDLNGMTFVVRKWGEDVVYCEESSGRAFLDPKDAFHEPAKHHIGYWNSEAETVSVRSEEEEDEQENQLANEPEPDEKAKPVEDKEEEEEEAEEEQEEGVELEEFEYKGQTYFRDPENQVYQANEDGEVDVEKAIGVWDEVKQKVLKYKV